MNNCSKWLTKLCYYSDIILNEALLIVIQNSFTLNLPIPYIMEVTSPTSEPPEFYYYHSNVGSEASEVSSIL